MSNKKIIWAARAVSMVFTPFYLPLLGVLILLFLSYMKLFPWQVKIAIALTVYILTLLLPTLLIHLYRRYQGWSPLQLITKERRMVPYVISILCYFLCYYIVNRTHMPRLINSLIVTALVVQLACALINTRWKISTHSAGIGAVNGALLAFGFLFNFDPTWWFCLTILLSGLVGTSRMILRQHSLSQIIAGFFLGLCCGFFCIPFV